MERGRRREMSGTVSDGSVWVGVGQIRAEGTVN